jgi:hypothetical protein
MKWFYSHHDFPRRVSRVTWHTREAWVLRRTWEETRPEKKTRGEPECRTNRKEAVAVDMQHAEQASALDTHEAVPRRRAGRPEEAGGPHVVIQTYSNTHHLFQKTTQRKRAEHCARTARESAFPLVHAHALPSISSLLLLAVPPRPRRRQILFVLLPHAHWCWCMPHHHESTTGSWVAGS